MTWKPPILKHRKMNEYGWRVDYPFRFTLGKYTDIGFGCYIQAESGVEIGEHTQIGGHALIYSVSTINDKKGPVKIGKHVRIGSFTVIMPGVTIGDNAVIGAYSYVDKDIAPGERFIPNRRGNVQSGGENCLCMRGVWFDRPLDSNGPPGPGC